MCRNNQTSHCLCHLIKPLIVADKHKDVRTTYFAPHSIEELYDFLKEAYAIISLKIRIEDVDSALKKLTDDYLCADSVCSINVDKERTKKAFLTAYEEYSARKINKIELYTKLEELTDDVQKLIYNNIGDNEDFDVLLVAINTKNERRHSFSLLAPPKDEPSLQKSKSPASSRSKEDNDKANKNKSENCCIM